jgi:hypothetical protein
MPAKTLPQLFRDNKISKAKYYGLKRQGRGPREMRDGRWVRVSDEAERDWHRELERNADENTNT